MGFPNLTARNILWNKLLNIKELVAKTGIKLSDYDLFNNVNNNLTNEEFNKNKGEIYNILNDLKKMNESEDYLLLIDNIIDMNITNIKNISNNLDLIKNITIIFYQWCLFNRGKTSNANAVK